MPSTPPSSVSMSSSRSSVFVLDQPGLEPGSLAVDQPFTVVKRKRSRKQKQPKPRPLSQPAAGTHSLLFRPKGKNASLETADFPVLLTILQALGALLPARWIRGGGLAVDFATAAAMESAASITALAGVAVRAAKPVLFACRTGVVSGVPPGLSPSAFISEVAAGNPDVQIHRAQRLGDPARSRTMKIVFVGATLPASLQFRFRSHPVRAFETRAPTAKQTLDKPAKEKLHFSAALAPPVPKPLQATTVPKKSSFSAALIASPAKPSKRKLAFSAALGSSPVKRPTTKKHPAITTPAAPAPVLVESAIQTDDVEPPAPIRQVFRPKSLRASSVMVAESCTQIRPVFFQRTRSTSTDLQAPPDAISLEILVAAAYCLGSSSLSSSRDADLLQLEQLILQHSSHPPDLPSLNAAVESKMQPT